MFFSLGIVAALGAVGVLVRMHPLGLLLDLGTYGFRCFRLSRPYLVPAHGFLYFDLLLGAFFNFISFVESVICFHHVHKIIFVYLSREVPLLAKFFSEKLHLFARIVWQAKELPFPFTLLLRLLCIVDPQLLPSDGFKSYVRIGNLLFI